MVAPRSLPFAPAFTRIARYVLCASLAACGGRPSTTTPASGPEAALHALNGEARGQATIDTLHGVEVRDPYRALESESELTTRWVAAQNARTESALTIPESTRARIGALLSIGAISDVTVAGSRLFFSRREGDQEQAIVYVRDLRQQETGDDGNDAAEEDRPLLDPTTMGERAAIDWYYPSVDGSLLAYGVSHNGDERSTLHILDVATGEQHADQITRTKWSTVSWLPDGTGFYYSRYPAPGEAGYDEEEPDSYFPRIFFHALGTDPATDPVVFGGEEGTDFPQPEVSKDGRYLVINNFRGWSESDVWIFDRTPAENVTRNAPTEEAPLVAVTTGLPNLTSGRVHQGTLYLTTNLDAPTYRIMKVALNDQDTLTAEALSQSHWQTFLPATDAPLEGWEFATGGFFTHYIEAVQSRLYHHTLNEDGTPANRQSLDLPLGAAGGLSIFEQEGTDPVAVFGFQSYLAAPSIMRANSRDVSFLARVDAGLDAARFETRRATATSADGTEVPVTLVKRADLPMDGSAPVLLYGYGGFNISLMPRFMRHAVYWLERGGIFAVANLRGGGEFGQQWHEAGALQHKEHVFEDFEAVIGWLTESGISQPDRIGIYGGSNGGLLMGAMITRVPERFAAAATYVGLYDMVRYHLFPPAQLWISEYGSADDANLFPVLHGYSPYHQVRENTAYPSVLIETADHDSRVHWAHSTKFAAALQEATSSHHPIYFYMQRAQGHGAGASRSDQVERYARMYTFLEAELEIPRFAPTFRQAAESQ